MNKKQILEDLITLRNMIMDDDGNCKTVLNLNKRDTERYYEIDERIQKLSNIIYREGRVRAKALRNKQ